MDINERNFAALEQALNTLNKQHSTLQQRMTKMENNFIILQGELANQKALTAHVLGRGMGSTVQES